MNANGSKFDADYAGGVTVDAEKKALELQAQGIESLGSNPRFKRQNLEAVGMTKEWDDNRRKNEDEIRRKFYSGDDEGFQRYLEGKVELDMKTRDSIWRYEQAQVKHGIRASREALSKSRNDQYGEAVLTGISAHHYEMAEELDRSGAAFNSQMDGAKKELSELKTRFPNLDTDEAKEELARIHGNIARYETERAGAVAATRVKNNAFFKEQYDGIVRWYADEHKRQYVELREEGFDHETAYMMASDAIGKNSEAMIRLLIDGGQGEGAQFFLDIMRDPESTKRVVVDENGNPKKVRRIKLDDSGAPVKDDKGETVYDEIDKRDDGSYLPQNILFMSRKTLDTLQNLIDSNVKEAIALKRARQSEVNRECNVRLRAIVHDAKAFAEDCYLKFGVDDCEQKKREFIGAVEQIYGDNPSVIANHRQVIVNAFRTAQKLHEKTASKVLAAKSQAEIDRMLSQMEQSNEYDVEATLVDANGEEYNHVVTMNNHKAIISTIEMARRSGMCKGKTYDDLIRKHESAFSRRDLVQGVLNQYFQYPLSGTRIYAGKAKNRAEGEGTMILCDSDSHGNTKLANVNDNNLVIHHVDVNWGLDKDYKVDGSTLSLIAQQLDSYFARSLNPKQEEVDEIMKTAIKAASDASNAKAFGQNVLLSVQDSLGLMFDPNVDAARYGEARRAEYERVNAVNESASQWKLDWMMPLMPESVSEAIDGMPSQLIKPRRFGKLQTDYGSIRSLIPLGVRSNALRIMEMSESGASDDDKDDLEIEENE